MPGFSREGSHIYNELYTIYNTEKQKCLPLTLNSTSLSYLNQGEGGFTLYCSGSSQILKMALKIITLQDKKQWQERKMSKTFWILLWQKRGGWQFFKESSSNTFCRQNNVLNLPLAPRAWRFAFIVFLISNAPENGRTANMHKFKEDYSSKGAVQQPTGWNQRKRSLTVHMAQGCYRDYSQDKVTSRTLRTTANCSSLFSQHSGPCIYRFCKTARL